MSSTPECDKMRAISHLSQTCGEFVDWLDVRKDFTLCAWDHENGCHYPAAPSLPSLLAEFFEIDLRKVDAEQREILRQLREEQQ